MGKEKHYHQPTIIDADGRQFSCFPVAIVVFLVNEKEEILCLSHPERKGQWEIVRGTVDTDSRAPRRALHAASATAARKL